MSLRQLLPRFKALLYMRWIFAFGTGLTGLGLIVGLIALLAEPLGLGIAEQFLFYERWGVPRRNLAVLGVVLAVAGGILFTLAQFGGRVRRFLESHLKDLALLTASVLFGLVGLEITVRLMDNVEFWPLRNLVAARAALLTVQTANEYHPILGWVLKPDISAGSGHPDTSFTTGEHGIRMNSAEIRSPTQGGLLAVGDSFTAGSEVGDRHSWPAQLERLMGEPVVNGAVGGWAADQIILRAEELFPILRPHTLIVSFFHDDILRAGYRVYGGANKPWFTIEGGKLVHHNNPVPIFTGKPEETGGPVLGYLHLATWVLERVGYGDWWRRVNTSYVLADNDPVNVTCHLLKRLMRRIAEDGIRLLLVLQHGGYDRVAATTEPEHALKVTECARNAGIETLDTWEPLVRANSDSLDFYRQLFVMHDENRVYTHMSSEGNALIARLIVERLRAAQPKAAAPVPRIAS